MSISPETTTRYNEAHELARRTAELVNVDLGDEAAAWREPTFYNSSVPFVEGDKTYQFIRVEERTDEYSTVMLFEVLENGGRQLAAGGPRFTATQDPYHLGSFADAEGNAWQVMGGVHITPDMDTGIISYHDVFYRYQESVFDIETDESGEPVPFAVGAEWAKDTRFITLSSGRIGVFPRPQGELGGPGSIGYFEIDSLDELESALAVYFEAQDPTTLVDGLFKEGEWGGINQILPSADGTLVLVGHKASWTGGKTGYDRKYRPFVARFDPNTHELASKVHYPDVDPTLFADRPPAKREELEDVVFTSGVLINEDPNYATLIMGIGDSAIGQVTIPNPIRFV